MSARLLALWFKESIALLRDRHGLLALFIMPTIFILVMTLALRDSFTPGARIDASYALVDLDQSASSAALSKRLTQGCLVRTTARISAISTACPRRRAGRPTQSCPRRPARLRRTPADAWRRRRPAGRTTDFAARSGAVARPATGLPQSGHGGAGWRPGRRADPSRPASCSACRSRRRQRRQGLAGRNPQRSGAPRQQCQPAFLGAAERAGLADLSRCSSSSSRFPRFSSSSASTARCSACAPWVCLSAWCWPASCCLSSSSTRCRPCSWCWSACTWCRCLAARHCNCRARRPCCSPGGPFRPPSAWPPWPGRCSSPAWPKPRNRRPSSAASATS